MDEIVNVRIDDRLIHGQVATFWTNMLGATRIMVIDDEISQDDVKKQVLRLAAPSNVNTSIISREQAINNLKLGKYKNQKIIIVVNRPQVLLDLVESGIDIKQINIGNLSNRDGAKQIAKSISINNQEYKSFRKLQEHGVDLIAQMVPNDQPNDFSLELDKYEKGEK